MVKVSLFALLTSFLLATWFILVLQLPSVILESNSPELQNRLMNRLPNNPPVHQHLIGTNRHSALWTEELQESWLVQYETTVLVLLGLHLVMMEEGHLSICCFHWLINKETAWPDRSEHRCVEQTEQNVGKKAMSQTPWSQLPGQTC